MKAVLVIDMPKSCFDCQLMVDGWCYGIPSREEVQGKIKYLKRPSWCPLKPMPKKKPFATRGRQSGFSMVDVIKNTEWMGWNECLDEIMGETE